jgi:hypothetical protein
MTPSFFSSLVLSMIFFPFRVSRIRNEIAIQNVSARCVSPFQDRSKNAANNDHHQSPSRKKTAIKGRAQIDLESLSSKKILTLAVLKGRPKPSVQDTGRVSATFASIQTRGHDHVDPNGLGHVRVCPDRLGRAHVEQKIQIDSVESRSRRT